MNLETLTLERSKFQLEQAISNELLLDVETNFWQDQMLNSVIYAFRTEIWSHKLPLEIKTESTQIQVQTWNSAWQLWKANHAGSKLLGWIVRRWPAQKRGMETHKATVTFEQDRRVLFPEANYPASAGTPYYRVVTTPPVWEWTE